MTFLKGNSPAPYGSATWGMDKKAIKSLLEKAGKSQADLARHMGWSDATVSTLLNGPRHLKADEADKIRRFLSMPALNAEITPTVDVQRADTLRELPPRSQMARDVPILGTAWGGESGDFTMNGDTGDFARRPPRYEGRSDVFALYVQGSSMEPRYFTGEMILVEKRRPAQNGDHVVVELLPRVDGVCEAYLKVLVARAGSKLRLQQYNPPKIIEIDMAKVGQILRVLSTVDLLGI